MHRRKKKLAYDTKDIMKAKSEQEKKRLKAAHEYMKNKYKDDISHPVRDTFSLLLIIPVMYGPSCNGNPREVL
ncbi:hypothetical protein [Peribacillus sp. SCS-37]|uniref:hypothetical protein n=1 Tax=Paraperibacillus esterisolvens TaxID=3115296 RepID=UPI0039061CAD